MPLSAKILAFLNVLAAGAFVYLAAIDWSVRQQWAYEMFRHELVIDGLPVDESDTGRRVDLPLFADLGYEDDDGSQAIIKDLFRPAGGKAPIKSQDAEVERVRVETMKEITALEEDKQRDHLGKLLLAQANTFDERDALGKMIADKDVSNDQLKALLNDRFEDVLRDISQGSENRDVTNKRRLIAHLLYNVSPSLEDHQRLMVIVGLKAYINEAETQARALREMVERTKLLTFDDRIAFEGEFNRQRDRIFDLAQYLDRQIVAVASLKDLQKRHKDDVIMPQEKRRDDLKTALGKAKKDTSDVLVEQAALEKKLFELHLEMGHLLEENQKLERDIRGRELGRVRGGQQ